MSVSLVTRQGISGTRVFICRQLINPSPLTPTTADEEMRVGDAEGVGYRSHRTSPSNDG